MFVGGIMSTAPTSQRSPQTMVDDYLLDMFTINQLISTVISIVPVRVAAVTGAGSLASCPYVSVQPLLNQLTGASQGVPHGVITNVPCWRLQAGTAAVIVDPVVGDVGLMLVAYRDSTPLTTTDQTTPGSLQGGSDTYSPGSLAQYDWCSGFYLGGWLNGAASQYVQLNESGFKVVAPTINLNGLTIDASGNLTTSGTITSAGKVLSTHIHSGVTTGGGDSGPPV
jgi:hypothetical protein